MSNALLNRAWLAPDLTPAAKLVLVRLADRANAENVCFPTHSVTARECCVCERQLRRILAALVAAKHITAIEQAHHVAGGKARFRYHVHPQGPTPTPDTMSPVTPDTMSPVSVTPDTHVPCDTGHLRPPHRTFETPPIRRTQKNPKEEGKHAHNGRFTPPTPEELTLHAAKIGLPPREAEKFAAYYASKGWTVGKAPMKCWKAAMTGWKLRCQDEAHKPNPRNAGIALDPDRQTQGILAVIKRQEDERQARRMARNETPEA